MCVVVLSTLPGVFFVNVIVSQQSSHETLQLCSWDQNEGRVRGREWSEQRVL